MLYRRGAPPRRASKEGQTPVLIMVLPIKTRLLPDSSAFFHNLGEVRQQLVHGNQLTIHIPPDDFAFLVNQEIEPSRTSCLFVIRTVLLYHDGVNVAEERVLGADQFLELLLRCPLIARNRENLDSQIVEFFLICTELGVFSRSTGGERCREKRQQHLLLAGEIL